MKGTVIFVSSSHAQVLAEDGSRPLCSIKGKRIDSLQGTYNGLAVGDFVEISPIGHGRGLIHKMFERTNVFGRYNEKGKSDQAIAANVDLVVCVSSADLPPFRPRFIDRVAIMAESASIPFLIAFNKTDLGVDSAAQSRIEGYVALGYGAVYTSVRTGGGLSELKGLLAGKCSVFVGQSGVGKSSLINALVPDAALKVGDISLKYNRGKHTTTMAKMITQLSPPTRLIDTPGMRRLAVRGIAPDDLIAFFPEMAALVENCEYGASCTHTEETGCAVRRALELGEVHPDRFESYQRIRGELIDSIEWRRSGTRDPGRGTRALENSGKRRHLSKWLEDESEEDGSQE